VPEFFEGFRRALASFPAGLVRAANPASDTDIREAEGRLGRSIPAPYVEFLRLFDGADLFHESILLGGVGPGSSPSLVEANRPARRAEIDVPDSSLVFGASSAGDCFLLDAATADVRVLRVAGDTNERWLAGSTFPRWLDAVLARERILYGDDGEFLLEAFESDGEELAPIYSLRQAERALRRDAGSADSHHDQGLAFRRLGRLEKAGEAFAHAAHLDSGNPWPWFHLGRIELTLGHPDKAEEAFRRAAAAVPGSPGARFLMWSARGALEAGRRGPANEAKAEALARNPDLARELERAVQAATAEEDPTAHDEALALFALVAPGAHLPLPVLAAGPRRPPIQVPSTSAAVPSTVDVKEGSARPPRRPARRHPRRGARRRP
jgi:hypothetical protein